MKVLLLNPAVEECSVPHYGLASLSAVLISQGYSVRVADYHYTYKTPAFEEIYKDFKPDIIGISMFSVTKAASSEFIDRIRRINDNIPIICGGPHTACYWEDMVNDYRIDYIVIGEAEDYIVCIASEAKREKRPIVVKCQYPDVNDLPFPDYTSFYRHDEITIYPIVTSRGCPYNCTFCAVGKTNSKKWRNRSVDSCMEELTDTKNYLTGIKEVVIWDDNFNVDKDRGKRLIKGFINNDFGYTMRSANIRADKVDKDLILLLKKAGCQIVQLGTEHGDPQIFKSLRKGETLSDIRHAASLVKRHGLKLYLSFVIGLPGDNIQKTLTSVRFSRELKADLCYWNILVPYRGTEVYNFFKSVGRVDDSVIPFTLVSGQYNELPNADTDDFSGKDRVVAHKIAQILTGRLSLRGGNLWFVLIKSVKHNFLKDLFEVVLIKIKRKLFT